MTMHDFFLVAEQDYPYQDYIQAGRVLRRRGQHLDDDFVWYIADTLAWIPTINPANQQHWSGCGLNLAGPTIINHHGATIAGQIFAAWATLFMHGSTTLTLRGPWTEPAESDAAQAGYGAQHRDRDALVTTLQHLAAYAEQARGGQFYILHLGM
jgi:hypothetical protein